MVRFVPQRVCVCVSVIASSCSDAVPASGLFIVTASRAVTANGEAQFVFGFLRGFVWSYGRVKTR